MFEKNIHIDLHFECPLSLLFLITALVAPSVLEPLLQLLG